MRIVEGCPALDPLQHEGSVAVEAPGVDAFAGWEIGGELAKSLAELAGSANGIASLGMVEADGEVNEGLQEEAPGAALRSPDFFPDFVALKIPPAIEQLDTALHQFVHVAAG